MGKDKKLEQIFIGALGEKTQKKSDIVSALTLMDTDELRKKVIDYILNNKDATYKDVQRKMAYLSVGIDNK